MEHQKSQLEKENRKKCYHGKIIKMVDFTVTTKHSPLFFLSSSTFFLSSASPSPGYSLSPPLLSISGCRVYAPQAPAVKVSNIFTTSMTSVKERNKGTRHYSTKEQDILRQKQIYLKHGDFMGFCFSLTKYIRTQEDSLRCFSCFIPIFVRRSFFHLSFF